jgi:mannose-6-phosphate isomerase
VLYPFTFRPIFKARVWGGRSLEQIYQKPLPPATPIGESWEVSDRPGDVSTIANGPLAGRDLRWLMENHASELLGSVQAQNGRFPLLIKLLDARQTLSVQVHPPPSEATRLGGEPKAEMWYVADAAPGAELYAGLKAGVTREGFAAKIQSGQVAECLHRVPVQNGDAIFLPSGRVHAIGAGLVIFEIQQNSDTTYRVFDWNRSGLDGRPRELHISESLACIDFQDFEPALISRGYSPRNGLEFRPLAHNPLFRVEILRAPTQASLALPKAALSILGVVTGIAYVAGDDHPVELRKGEFCVVPAGVKDAEVTLTPGSEVLWIRPGV